MDPSENAALFRERSQGIRDEMEKLRNPIDLSEYKWNVDVRRAETLADMKLFAETLKDDSIKHEDIKDIVDSVSKNITDAKNVEKKMDVLEAELKRNDERLKQIRQTFDRLGKEGYSSKIKVDTMDDINKMNKDQLNDKLKELFHAMEDIRVAREGPACIPEVRDGLEKYQKLLKGVQSFEARRPPFTSLYSQNQAGRTIRDTLLAKAEQMKASPTVIENIKNMPISEVDNDLTFANMMDMAKEKNIGTKDMAGFIRSTLSKG